MGWAIGYDSDLNRDVGYGVPAHCDHPGCNEEIDRGLAHACGGEPFGGEHGCGLHFCGARLAGVPQQCERCLKGLDHFDLKPDHPEWVRWKLADTSWQEWRDQHPEEVERLRASLDDAKGQQ